MCILILFTVALTWIAVIPGLSVKSVEGASAFSYPLIFLPFISSAFVPTTTIPAPVHVFAEHQPVTSIVNAIRDLFAQQPVGTDIWIAIAYSRVHLRHGHLLRRYLPGRYLGEERWCCSRPARPF